MIGRSSINKLAKTLYYTMSKKKITEQWRKPIEQLKQQKQQNTPIPPEADRIKKVAMEFMEKQYGKPNLKIQDDPSIKKAKKIFRKKGQQAQVASTQESAQTQQSAKVSEVNWLQLQQFQHTKQLVDLTNEALNMLKLKYHPELKEVLSKIKSQFHAEGLEYVLNSLFRQNFIQVYDELKPLGIEISKLNTRVINSIIFHLTQLEEVQRLESLLREIKNWQNFHLEAKQEEFFELLFFKETSQDVKFETGENSVNISADNKSLVKKIQVATLYLELVQDHGKKKKFHKRSNIIPIWMYRVSKIVLQYRFGHKQFQTLLTQVFTHHEYLVPESFYESEQFFTLLRQFYFGHQESLGVVLGVIQRNVNKNIKFSTFYRNFMNQLMNFRIESQQPAFEVDQQLVDAYKKGFQTHNKYLSIICAIIGSDARYKDLAEHYAKSYMIGFPNETLSSEDTKFVEEGILNNYLSTTDAQKHEKSIARLMKTGNNLFIKLKAAIKLGDLTQAYKIFEEEVLMKSIIQRQRKNIEFVLRSQLGSSTINFLRVKEINDFVNELSDEYLWSLYKRTEDVSVMLKKYIPDDKFSFWQEKQKKEQFEEISKKLASGELSRMKQPESDIEATGFNLDEYLNSEFPQLKELQNQEYEKEKEMIKFILRVEGLISVHKIHNDHLVIEKLEEFQNELSEQNLQTLQAFGLKDYNIQEYGWEHFEKRFNQMRTQGNIVRDQRLDWSGYTKFIERNKSLTKKSFIEEIIIKSPELFKEAEVLVKLNQEHIVNKLLLWGVYANEPMAVYLAEKLAMQTGQIIPHELALKVSRFLSHKRPMSQKFVERCKECLRIIGKIDREFIYSFDKDYEHILIRRNFVRHIEEKIDSKKYDNRDLEDLITFNPREQLYQKETRLYKESIVHRANLL